MSSSTRIRSSNFQKKDLESFTNETEFLFTEESSPDPSKIAAQGIDFLFNHFTYELHTFQFIKSFPDGKTASPVKTFTDKKKAFTTAFNYNKKGYDVYFMVNEGDGITHPGKRVPRSQQSVKELSKCFIDTDNCPVEKVRAYLDSLPLVPHIVIESSPGRFHFYFFIEPTEKVLVTIKHWKAVQNIMHRLGDPSIRQPAKTLGTDSTMHDFSKVLRVPGFMHTTKNFTVKVVEENTHPYYTLSDLFTITNAESYLDYNLTTFGTDEPKITIDLSSTSIIHPGDRYATLQTLAMSLANQANGHAHEQLQQFTHFIKTRIDNTDEIYCTADGTITAKSLALFESAVAKVKLEEATKIESIKSSIGKPTPSPWSLTDEFYLTAPNGFGDVVKQVMEYSLYPCAALAFGTFITGLSIIRAKTHFTPGGSSPALYTLNVAPAGYGKGDPMTLLQNMFWSLGYGKLLSNEIRSDRGLYEHLSANLGLGIFLLDEVAPLLKAIQDENAKPHHANIAKAILQLYSASAMKGVSFGKVAKTSGKKSEPEIVIDNPMLALCSYTVPFEFERLFNTDSVAKGLFQRFIPIVAEICLVPSNPTADRHAIIKSDLFNPSMSAQELDDDGNPVEPLETPVRRKARYTGEAARLFAELKDKYRDALITAAKDPDTSHMSGLYSRLAEQIERIATVLSQDEISLGVVEYAARFIESRHQATLAVAHGTILKDRGSAAMEREEKLLRAIAKECTAQESAIVYKTDVYKKVRKTFSSIKEFDIAVAEAAELGKIALVPDYQKTSDKTGKLYRKGLGIKLLDVLEN